MQKQKIKKCTSNRRNGTKKYYYGGLPNIVYSSLGTKKSICTLCFIAVQQMQSNIEFIEIVEVQEDIVRIKH